jgi:nucleotide-binding universal stress UspA family protein
MGNPNRTRILVAVDGSEQALEAVRYVSNTLEPLDVEVVLFHVLTKVPESFWDLEKEPAFRYDIASIKAWEDQQQKLIEDFMTQARQVLLQAGIPREAVAVDVHERKEGIARDILAESLNGYDAVVLGRKGLSELKDLVIGSTANKLVERLVDVPVWLVGGKSQRGKVLIPVDASDGAMRAVQYVADVLQGSSKTEVTLLHAVRGFDIFQRVLGRSFVPSDENGWVEQAAKELEGAGKEMEPVFAEARDVLTKAGLRCDSEHCKIVRGVSSRAGAIVKEAENGGYDTIVVGRRGISKVQEFFMGRVSNKVIQLAKDKTIWVVS